MKIQISKLPRKWVWASDGHRFDKSKKGNLPETRGNRMTTNLYPLQQGIDFPAILIKTTRRNVDQLSLDAVYEATRGFWVIGADRRNGGPKAPTHAVSVYQQRVIAVFEIVDWEFSVRENRWAFIGKLDSDKTSRLINFPLDEVYPKGSQNPIRYVNCQEAILVHHITLNRQAESDRVDIASLAQKLKNDVLYNLMSANRELFHSNLIGWIFRNIPEITTAFLSQYGSAGEANDDFNVRLEYQNIDLLLQSKGFQPLAIENKIFADLSENQLEGYSRTLASEFGRFDGILLSFIEPNWDQRNLNIRGNMWSWLSYGEFVNFLEKQLRFLEPEPFVKEFLIRYINMCRTLQLLIDHLKPSVDDPHISLTDEHLDVGPKMLNSLNKMRFRLIARFLKEQLSEDGAEAQITSGMTNGQALLTWQTVSEDGTQLGWQFQGNQFRLFARVPHLAGKGQESHMERVTYLENNHLSWFNFDDLTSSLIPRLRYSPMKNESKFCKFDPDFVYKYIKVPNLPIETLVQISTGIARRTI